MQTGKPSYIEEAHVTCSNFYYGEQIPFEHFKKVLKEAITALQNLDQIKKALFYGKGIDFAGEQDNCLAFPLWIGHNREEEGRNILHGIIGAATETGELLEALYNCVIDNGTFDLINVGEEVGDCFWYFALLAKACGFTFNEAQEKNIAKLRARYPNKFTKADAINRNLIAERKILEK